MLSKCANPECSTTLHYLRDGKIFKIEVSSSESDKKQPYLVSGSKPSKRVEHFWLCGPCSRWLTLRIEEERGVITEPIRRPMVRRAAAS